MVNGLRDFTVRSLVGILTMAPVLLFANDLILSEIVVTAQKREQNVQDVPIAITSVSGDELALHVGVDVQSMTQLIPGFQYSLEGEDVNVFLRGSRGGGGVSLYQDGILRLESSQFEAVFVDTSRIEAARGPQGTLNGRNSYAGSLNVITNAPQFDAVRFGVDETITNYSGNRTELFLNLPVNDILAFRLSGYRERRDGVIRNLVNPAESLQDRNNDYGRFQIGFKPSDTFSAVLRWEEWRSGGNGSGDYGVSVRGVPINPLTGNTTAGVTTPGIVVPRVGVSCNDPSFNPLTASPIGAPGSAAPQQGGIPAAGPCNQAADPGPFAITRNTPNIRDVYQHEFNGEVNWDITDGIRLRGLFSHIDYNEYRQADGDYGPSGGMVLSAANPDNPNPGGQLPGLITVNEVSDHGYSEELQLLSTGHSKNQWVVGTYLLQDHNFGAFDYAYAPPTGQPFIRTPGQFNLNPLTIHCCQANPIPGGPAIPGNSFIWYFPVYTHLDSKSVYADDVFSATDQFRLIGGVRYTRDYNKGESKFFTLDGNDNPSYDNEVFKKFTWRAGFESDLAKDHMVYFTASTGFIAGGSNPGGIKPFGPQTNSAYEIGSKNMFLDGTLRLNVDAYFSKYDNLLISYFNPNTSLTTLFNKGSSTSRGVEFEARWLPIKDLRISVVGDYLRSQLGNFLLAAEGTLQEGMDLPAQYGNQKGFVANGLSTRNAPRFSVSTSTDYDIQLGKFGILTPGVDLTWVDKYRTREAPLFYATQDPYTKIDVRAGWKIVGSPWSAQFFMTNVKNEAIRIFSTPNQGGIIYDQYMDPRIYGIRFTYRSQ